MGGRAEGDGERRGQRVDRLDQSRQLRIGRTTHKDEANPNTATSQPYNHQEYNYQKVLKGVLLLQAC